MAGRSWHGASPGWPRGRPARVRPADRSALLGQPERTATPTRLAFEVLEQPAREILDAVPGVVSVTYNIASKPPSTIEAV